MKCIRQKITLEVTDVEMADDPADWRWEELTGAIKIKVVSCEEVEIVELPD